MSQQYEVTFKTDKLKNVRVGDKPLKSFVLREIDGTDEELASQWAKSKGGSATTGEESVRLAIVEVNGERVKQPYLAFDTWNSRARNFALVAFRSLNGTTEEEVDGFLAAAELPTGGADAASATA